MADKEIVEMIEKYPEKKKLPCSVAHFIAASLDVEPSKIGEAADEFEVVLTMCQLGLFGYGRKGKSSYKVIGRKVEVPDSLLDKIRAAAVDSRISCTEIWKIADEEGVDRSEAGNAADSLGIKIKPCQLGAF